MIPCVLRKIDSEGRACEGPSWQHQQGSYPPSPLQQHQQDSYLPSHCSTLSPVPVLPFHKASQLLNLMMNMCRSTLSSSSTALLTVPLSLVIPLSLQFQYCPSQVFAHANLYLFLETGAYLHLSMTCSLLDIVNVVMYISP